MTRLSRRSVRRFIAAATVIISSSTVAVLASAQDAGAAAKPDIAYVNVFIGCKNGELTQYHGSGTGISGSKIEYYFELQKVTGGVTGAVAIHPNYSVSGAFTKSPFYTAATVTGVPLPPYYNGANFFVYMYPPVDDLVQSGMRTCNGGGAGTGG